MQFFSINYSMVGKSIEERSLASVGRVRSGHPLARLCAAVSLCPASLSSTRAQLGWSSNTVQKSLLAGRPNFFRFNSRSADCQLAFTGQRSRTCFPPDVSLCLFLPFFSRSTLFSSSRPFDPFEISWRSSASVLVWKVKLQSSCSRFNI